MKRVEAVSPERYRMLAVTHLALLCLKRGIPITQLEDEVLRAAGASIVKDSFGIAKIEIDVPADSVRDLRAELFRISINENRDLLSRADKKTGRRKKGFAKGYVLDEALMGSTSPSARPKDRF